MTLDLLRHRQKSARDHCHLVAQPLQRAAKQLRTRREYQILFYSPEELLRTVTPEQGHPGLEGLEKVQLATHGSLCYGLHLLLHTHELRQFVDNLLLDQRAVHVKNHKASHPTVHVVTLESKVRTLCLDRLQQLFGEGGGIQLPWQVHCDLQGCQLPHGEAFDLHHVHSPLRQDVEDRFQARSCDGGLLHHGEHIAVLKVVRPTGGRALQGSLGNLRLFSVEFHLETRLMACKEEFLNGLVGFAHHPQFQAEAHAASLEATLPHCGHLQLGLYG
mmetsp:Transcript_44672/g.101137  ORF Transcript_44672/g.101137 Transcript_44672/m.101137 type:complete len:274 (+) Transcript_44672:393-1214(+)